METGTVNFGSTIKQIGTEIRSDADVSSQRLISGFRRPSAIPVSTTISMAMFGRCVHTYINAFT